MSDTEHEKPSPEEHSAHHDQPAEQAIAQDPTAAQPTAQQPTAQDPTAQQPTAPQPTAPQPTAPTEPLAPAARTPQPPTPHYGPNAGQPYGGSAPAYGAAYGAGQPVPQHPGQAGQPQPGAAQPGQPYAGQPYAGQPYASQPHPGQPHVAGAPQQHPAGYAQHPGQPGAQPQPGQYPVGSAFGAAAMPQAPGAASTRSPRRRGWVGVGAAVVIASLLAGSVATGITLAVADNGSGTPVSSGGSGPTTITVNDPGNATTVTGVAAKASPSVVTIDVTASSEAGTGSGVILNSEGDILTNTHVVTLDGASDQGTIKVTLNDGRIFSGTIVGTDPVSDLAVVKIDGATDLQPATFADSTKLNVGDQAVAIGAPLGLSGTVTEGIISALNRSITIASSAVPDDTSDQSQSGQGSQSPFNFDFGQGQTQTQSQGTIALSVIQTDAAINPGNSGGALLDSDGKVIGINVAIASASQSSEGTQSGSIGVGFAIPAELAQRVAKEIMANGKATHGMLGATIEDAATNSNIAGATVHSVTNGGAADKAGLQSGDVITKIGDQPVTDSTDCIAEVRAQEAGAKVSVTYVRDGKSYDTDVTLGTYTD